jgi:Xaa-Pro aminopeptidase
MTRTFFFGKATNEQKHAYQTVLGAQKKAIELLDHKLVYDPLSKIMVASIDKVARDYIIKEGYPSIPHSLGHGIGLEVHEAPSLSPRSKQIITNGIVFSIEPGIYIPDKFGVRIEDLFAIVNNKLVQLTKSPSKLLEI